MGKFIDLTGQTFGHITVLSRAENIGKSTMWLGRCDCGNVRAFRASLLLTSQTKSCGCRTSQPTIERNYKHGMAGSPEHKIWVGIKTRCFNERNKHYKNYGARGITVCPEWRESFEAFYRDMGPRPSPRHTVERRNNDGNYEPANCYWLNLEKQALNRRNTMFLTHNGETKTLVEWSNITGLSQQTLRERMYANWPHAEALTTPTRATRNAKRQWPRQAKKAAASDHPR